MKEQYKKVNDSIHVPEDLMRCTKAVVRQEERKRNILPFVKYAAAAACLCLVCFGVWGFSIRDIIFVGEFESVTTELSVEMNLGKHDAAAPGGDVFSVSMYDAKEEIPSGLLEQKASRISRKQVYIGKTEDGMWHAVFEKDEGYCYVTAEENIPEEDFIKYLKKML